MKNNPSIVFWASMSVIRNLILLGSKNETEIAAVCKAGKIDPIDLNNLDARVPLENKIAILQKLLELTEDKDLGLHLGEKAAPPMLGQAGHLQQSSKDVLTAFKKTFHFSRTFSTVYDSRIEEKDSDCWLFYEPVIAWVEASPVNARHGVNIPFAATMNFIRLLSGRTVYPTKVFYRGYKEKDTTEHERIFGCVPTFNQDANCMVFRSKDLEVPILGYNPQLSAVIEKLLQERIREFEDGVRFTTKVREAIATNYQFDFPQLENVALALNITPRTLQRRLQDENTTYRELTDSIRYELASTLLKYKDLTISEIGYKLGYADLKGFRKAFKQWSGVSPLDYRSAID
jgi:AraC-like DNA-binding protein